MTRFKRKKECLLCHKWFGEGRTPDTYLCPTCDAEAHAKGLSFRRSTCKRCGRVFLRYKGGGTLCPDCEERKKKMGEEEKWSCPAGFNYNKEYKCANCGKKFKPLTITYTNGRITKVAGWQTCSLKCTREMLDREGKR